MALENVQVVAVEKLIHGRKSIGTPSFIQELLIKMYPMDVLRLTEEIVSAGAVWFAGVGTGAP